jgi:hypothetical protein
MRRQTKRRFRLGLPFRVATHCTNCGTFRCVPSLFAPLFSSDSLF